MSAFRALCLAIVAAGSLASTSDAQTLFASDVPAVAHWQTEPQAEGSPGTTGCTAMPADFAVQPGGSSTSEAFLTATEFDPFVLPAGRSITKVEIDVLCGFANQAAGNIVVSVSGPGISGTITSSTFTSPSSVCGWRLQNKGDISTWANWCSNPDLINLLTISVRRIDSNTSDFRVKAFRIVVTTAADADRDCILDGADNCPTVANANQANADGDAFGDVCDSCTDTDGDGRGNPGYPANTCATDNCPSVSNPTQVNADGDAFGDACDTCTDTDGDGNGNPGYPGNTCATDNCPTVANANQANADGDSFGDACDTCTDTDADGFGNPGYPGNTCPVDNCPNVYNPPWAPGYPQFDDDNDGIGDACDTCTDTDGDGFGDPFHSANTCVTDNCPDVANPSQANADGDATGDACDWCTDLDGDGAGEPGFQNYCALDNCPGLPNDQKDFDADGVGDACDVCTDADGDGFGDSWFSLNNCPRDNCASRANTNQRDIDGDGIGDACDTCPNVADPNQVDSDADGYGDACDPVHGLPPDDQRVLLAFQPTGFLLGSAVAGMGDLDGDARPDFAVTGISVEWGYPTYLYLVSGGSGRILRQIAEGVSADYFRKALSGGVGFDSDLDGVPDTIVGHPEEGSAPTLGGRIRVWSARLGALLYEVAGSSPGDEFGASLDVFADLDHDGRREILVGAPGRTNGSGEVYVLSGLDGNVLRAHQGNPASRFGTWVADVGDLNSDGVHEYASGAPNAGAGSVQIFDGSSGGLLDVLSGDNAGDGFGAYVDLGGDFDGDARSDLVVSARSFVRIFRASDRAVVRTLAITGYGPSNVVAPGDFDGDGVADLAVGWPSASEVRVISGLDGKVLSAVGDGTTEFFTGQPYPVQFGWSVAAIGDVDRDGRADLVVGAPEDPLGNTNADSNGAAFVLAGPFSEAWNRQGNYDKGDEIAYVGDVDGDGADDIAFGTQYYGGQVPHAGRVDVVSGRDRSPIWSSLATQPYTLFGHTLARAGDVNADGVPDLLVGAPYENGGVVRVLSGVDGSVLQAASASAPNDYFGMSVAGMGDLNGDGRADYAVGAPKVSSSDFWELYETPSPGYVRVFSGFDGSLIHQIDGTAVDVSWCDPNNGYSCPGPGDGFGFALAAVGDVDGDGVGDLLASAPSAGDPFYRVGEIRVYSGANWNPVYQLPPDSYLSDQFGIAVTAVGDVDGDGRADFAAAGQQLGTGPDSTSFGWVTLYSGATGTPKWTRSGHTPPGYGSPVAYGYAISGGGDFDFDGVGDIAIGDSPSQDALGPGTGTLSIISGATGRDIGGARGHSGWDYLGYAVAANGDANGDGIADVVVGAPGSFSQNRSRIVYGSRPMPQHRAR